MFTNLREIFTSLQEEKCTNHHLNMLHLSLCLDKISGNHLQPNTLLLNDKTSAQLEEFNKTLYQLHPPTKASGNKHQEDEILKLRII
jgi:hypothetical protein